MNLILASKSPRREKILSSIFTEFTIYNPEVEEECINDSPEDTVKTNALLKAKVTAEKFSDSYIIAADTIISFEGKIIGKPVNIDEAYKILLGFSGKKHEVITAVAFYKPVDKTIKLDICKTDVYFKKLSDKDITRYHKLVSPLDKAGGYNIDEHIDIIIEKIDGSKTNVMGLPIEVIRKIKNDNCRKL
jgi:septum formation protein